VHRAGCAGRCLRSGSARRALGGHPSSRTPTSFLQVAKFTRESDSPAEQAGFEPLVPLATASLDYRGGEGAAGRSGLSKRRHCFSRGDQRFESPSLQQRVRVSHRPGRCTSNTPVLRADERCGKNAGYIIPKHDLNSSHAPESGNGTNQARHRGQSGGGRDASLPHRPLRL
jgi:hypothetical protein